MRWPVRTAAAIAAISAVLAGCGQAQDGSASAAGSVASAIPTVLVLDSSGSMSEAEAAGTRMDAAKTAATGLVEALPDDAVLGLVAYGTSTGGSDAEKAAGCADVRTLQRAVAVDRGAVTAAIGTLEPSGFTPIGTALRHAAELLPTDGEVAIVLLSDGEDTCAPPEPCEIARELKAQRPGLTISTVGFKTANEELSCIASATGGLYLTADNTDQLVSRLVAAQNVSGNAEAMTPTGLRGIELGQSAEEIKAAHPDFPGLAQGRADGDRTVIVWRDCDWAFEGGVLTEIRPGAQVGHRNVDGLVAGVPVSKAAQLYGDAVGKQANPDGSMTSLFTASEQAGTAWKVGHRDDTIETIYLCKCLPKSGAAEPGGRGSEVIGATTIKRITPYNADGTLSLTVGTATKADRDYGCSPMDFAPSTAGLYRCGPYATDGTTYFCSVATGMATCPVLADDTFSGGLKFTTAPVVWEGSPVLMPIAGEIPWAMQLDDGTRCAFGSVFGPGRVGYEGLYRCASDMTLWAPEGSSAITESAGGWTVQVAGESGPMRTATVRTAILLTRE